MKPKQKIELPMHPDRRLAVYTRQRGADIRGEEADVARLTPKQRRRYLKKIPYWQRLGG